MYIITRLPGGGLVTDICAVAHQGPSALYTNLKSANVKPPPKHTHMSLMTFGFQMFEIISADYRLNAGTYLTNKSTVLDLFPFYQNS